MYATATDMIARFGETQILRLSNPEDLTATTVDVVKVNQAIADATALIDGYLRKRYEVPVMTPPVDLIAACCKVARYELAQGERTTPTEQMKNDRSDVMKWLEQISRGVVNLDAPLASGAVGQSIGSGPRYSDRPRDFDHDTLRNM